MGLFFHAKAARFRIRLRVGKATGGHQNPVLKQITGLNNKTYK